MPQSDELSDDDTDVSIVLVADHRTDDAKSLFDDQGSVRSSQGSVQSISHLNSKDVVLAMGRILFVNNLPPPIQEDRDGRVFFRILYAGGEKTNSALFQCKTCIFESEKVMELSERIQWKRSSFKFEIDKMTTDFDDNIPAQGDIIIAIYRQRSYGGNEFIGQTVIGVDRLISEGEHGRGATSEYITEKRSVKSLLQIFDRSCTKLIKNASISIDISLSWRSSEPSISPGIFASAIPTHNASLKYSQSASISAYEFPSPIRPGIEMGTRGVASNGRGGSVATLSRPKSAGALQRKATTPGLTISALKPRLNKAQKEFQWKVERENKSMQSRLMKHITKASDVGKLGSIYGSSAARPQTSGAREATVRESDAKEQQQMDKIIRAPVDSEHDKLVGIYAQLCAEVAAAADENKELAACLSRLCIQARKWEVTQDRVSKESGDKERALAVSTRASLLPPWLNFLRELEKREREAVDVELAALLEEYRYLQDTRRSMKQRIDSALTEQRQHTASIQSGQEKLAKFNSHAMGVNEPLDRAEDDKLYYFKQLEDARLELLRLQGLEDFELHLTPLLNAIAEAEEGVKHLRCRLADERRALELAEYSRDLLSEKISSAREDGVLEKCRSRIDDTRRDIIRLRVELSLPPSHAAIYEV